MNRASIDLGSNSLLLTVLDAQGRVLHDEARVVGLGRGLGDGGRFRPDRVALAREVLRDYARVAAGHGVAAGDIAAVATSGARRASDAEALFASIEADFGLKIRTISGDEEAVLSFRGALRGLDTPPGERMVIDLGGGSTEVVLGIDRPEWRISLEIGSVRLTERFLGERDYAADDIQRLREHVELAIAPVREALGQRPAPGSAISVAGTATTLAAIDLGLQRYDGARVHGHALTLAALTRIAAQLAVAGPAQRRQIAAVSAERADFLLAGATVIGALLSAAGLPHTRVSDGGLRFGILAPTP